MRKDTVMNATLVILAAGLGSRFGGNKQISCVGPNDECLMEYSIHDAIDAGFDRVVFILKEEMIPIVREKIGERLARRVRVDYAVQDYSTIPTFYHIPKTRVKPFGTVHALLSASKYLDAPFATVNADDYYGKEAYRILYRMLATLASESDAAMVPYILGNTMSRNGGVTRGVCAIKNGVLCKVDETKNIHYGEQDEILSDNGELSPDAMVSMNIWGFHPDFVPRMQTYFEDFLRALPEGEEKAECLLPIMVDDLIAAKKLTVKAESSPDKWFGLTYRADIDEVKDELAGLHENGTYPETLF